MQFCSHSQWSWQRVQNILAESIMDELDWPLMIADFKNRYIDSNGIKMFIRCGVLGDGSTRGSCLLGVLFWELGVPEGPVCLVSRCCDGERRWLIVALQVPGYRSCVAFRWRRMCVLWPKPRCHVRAVRGYPHCFKGNADVRGLWTVWGRCHLICDGPTKELTAAQTLDHVQGSHVPHSIVCTTRTRYPNTFHLTS